MFRGRHVGDGVKDAGYLLIQYIGEIQGERLSQTWSDKRHDLKLRTNFFRGLSRILLSISRIPLPRIRSFTIDWQWVLKFNKSTLINWHTTVGERGDPNTSTL